MSKIGRGKWRFSVTTGKGVIRSMYLHHLPHQTETINWQPINNHIGLNLGAYHEVRGQTSAGLTKVGDEVLLLMNNGDNECDGFLECYIIQFS